MNIIAAHKQCVFDVYVEDYYVDVFESAVGRLNQRLGTSFTTDTISDLVNAEDIVTLWNNFWIILPDSPSIHRPPFDLVCEICEYDYREDDE